MENNQNKGSIWQKWDLHMHSPKVFLNNQFGNVSVDDFVNKISESEIVAVGLTNYFRFDDSEFGEIKNKLIEKDIVVFPSIEFRTQPPNKENEEMHVHVLFSNEVSIQKIMNFLGRLKTVDGKYCKDLTVEDIKTTTVSIDTLKNTLAEDEDIKHLEDYLIVACPRGQGSFRPSGDDDGRGNNFAIVIDKYSDVLFGNSDDTEFFLSQDRYKGAKPKPVLFCSDAHKLDDIGKKFSWIKSEKTFEGLKQILYDPQSRVAIQDNEPVQPNNVIDSITFNIPTNAKITVKQRDGCSEKEEVFCFAGANSTYYLSPFFNCFIGGRGSGKSTILNFLGQHSKDPGSSQSFWEKIQPSFDTTDSNIFSFEGVTLFEFIGQSEVESFATDKEAFTNAIYERANILSDGVLERDEEKLENLLKNIHSFQSLIEAVEDLLEEKKLKEKEKTALESAVKVTKSQEYSQIVDDITKRSNQKQKLEGWRTAIDELRNTIEEVKEQHFSVDSGEGVDEDIPAEGEGENNIAQKYQEAYEQVKTNISNAAEILNPNKFKDLVKKENALAKEIEELEKKLSELLKKAGLSDENILQVKSAPQKIVKIDDELLKLNKRIEDKQKEINGYDEVLKQVKKVKKEYEEVIENGIKPLADTLKEQAEGNDQKDIKSIGLNYFFDEQEVWRQIANEFYSYFSEQHGDGERPDLLKNYVVENKNIFADDQKKIKKFLTKQEKKVGYIKFLKDVFDKQPNYQIFLTIRDKHLNDVAKYKRIQVLYDGKDIERASFGQKCAAVMVVLLLFGNYPLIIDEPEAHLDSSLIANYLVSLIKRKKNNRQIIFATHNANFVVNGDSEKIFILKNETGTTEVIETTIENLENRDELLKLEGGRDAFRKRGEKLHI